MARATSIGVRRLVVSERSTDHGAVPASKRVLRMLYGLADCVVTNSRTQCEVLSRRRAIAKRIRWIPNCVDLERFKPAAQNGPNRSPMRILTIASFQGIKNPGLIAKWCLRHSPRHHGFQFDWFGNQLLSEKPTAESGNCFLQTQAMLGGHERFRLHGPVSDPERLYREADAFCLPSFYEGMPNVICEAMACGLPVLCSRVSDNPTLVEDGVNGFLFDPADLNSFSSALGKLEGIGIHGRLRMGSLNRSKAEALFSQEAYLTRWMDALFPRVGLDATASV
jgi:glycosyltransferase involved in cell wall biosynthesis